MITKTINFKDRNQIQDFESGTRFYFQQILKKLYGMIIFKNLPESINETFLKQTLFINGKIAFFENDGELLALNCQYSNTPNVYYIPENVIIANPVIGSKNLKIDEECTIVYCSETDVYNVSTLYGGLYSLIMRTAQQLSDCDISINCYLKNTRVLKYVVADDDITKASAQIALQKMYDGETVIVGDSNLIAKVQALDMFGNGSTANISQNLIEIKQYILSHFYHEIGLNTNDNMKKAHLLETEVNTNTNLVRANIQNIIETIAKGVEKVNEMFGTEITIELSDIYRQSEAEEVTDEKLYNDNVTESNVDLVDDEPAESADAEELPPSELEPEAEEEPTAEEEEPAEDEPAGAAAVEELPPSELEPEAEEEPTAEEEPAGAEGEEVEETETDQSDDDEEEKKEREKDD